MVSNLVPAQTQHSMRFLLYPTLNSNYKRNIPSLGIFIDLKAVFDNLTFDSITAALHQLEVPQNIIHWIINYISHRNVTFKLGAYSITRHIQKGCSEGMSSHLSYSI
jgi:hypothetical protein